MNSEAIRKRPILAGDYWTQFWLQEIAAQLAELNEKFPVPPEVKEPAVVKVVPINTAQNWSQCCICRPETDLAGHYCEEHVLPQPGGCVSVPDSTQTLSERLQDDLEPLPNEGKRFCV